MNKSINIKLKKRGYATVDFIDPQNHLLREEFGVYFLTKLKLEKIMTNEFSIDLYDEEYEYGESGEETLVRRNSITKNLNPKEHQFVTLMAKDPSNAAANYRAAGYGNEKSSPQSLASGASRLMKKKGIKEAIALTNKMMIESAGLDEYEVINEIRTALSIAKANEDVKGILDSTKQLGNYLGMWDKDGKGTGESAAYRSKTQGMFGSDDTTIEEMLETKDGYTVLPKAVVDGGHED
jgi:hypothetical protein